MTVWFDGIDDINSWSRDLAGAPDRASRAIHVLLVRSGANISAGGKRRAVRDTGAMANSVGWDYERVDDATSEVRVGPTVEYAPYVEWGTSTQPPRAFMGPAFDYELPRFESALAAIGVEALHG